MWRSPASGSGTGKGESGSSQEDCSIAGEAGGAEKGGDMSGAERILTPPCSLASHALHQQRQIPWCSYIPDHRVCGLRGHN